MHDVNTAQPGCGSESCNVGGGATTKTHDCVFAVDSDAAQHFPEESDDLKILAGLGVG